MPRARKSDFRSRRDAAGADSDLIGSDPASELYVRNKIRACKDVGIRSHEIRFSPDVPQQVVIETIEDLNQDPSVHGILVQLPLPTSFDLPRILHTISVEKDVDGFHLYNVRWTGGRRNGVSALHAVWRSEAA